MADPVLGDNYQPVLSGLARKNFELPSSTVSKVVNNPGEALLEESLKPIGLSQNRLSLGIGVHTRRITADTALRLARYFGTSPQFWMADRL
jgi:addiction module HigA family antidote